MKGTDGSGKQNGKENLRRRKENRSRKAELSKMRGGWLLGAYPVPPPEGPLMLKLKDVDADLSSRIKDAEVMSFHVTGCTAIMAMTPRGEPSPTQWPRRLKFRV